MPKLRAFFFLLVLIPILRPVICQTKEISQEQARELVLLVLQSRGFDPKSPNLVVDDWPDDPDMPGFYLFGAHTIAEGMNFSAGAFAVGRRTVEVWNWMHCWRFSRAKSVRARQKELRKEIGLTDREYRKLSSERPFCFSVPVREK